MIEINDQTGRPRNISELREQLLEAFDWVLKDPRRGPQVREMVNAAGKVINTVKCEIEYEMIRLAYNSRGVEPKFIPFLGSSPKLNLPAPSVESNGKLKNR